MYWIILCRPHIYGMFLISLPHPCTEARNDIVYCHVGSLICHIFLRGFFFNVAITFITVCIRERPERPAGTPPIKYLHVLRFLFGEGRASGHAARRGRFRHPTSSECGSFQMHCWIYGGVLADKHHCVAEEGSGIHHNRSQLKSITLLSTMALIHRRFLLIGVSLIFNSHHFTNGSAFSSPRLARNSKTHCSLSHHAYT